MAAIPITGAVNPGMGRDVAPVSTFPPRTSGTDGPAPAGHHADTVDILQSVPDLAGGASLPSTAPAPAPVVAIPASVAPGQGLPPSTRILGAGPIFEDPEVTREEASPTAAPVTRLYQEGVNWAERLGEAVFLQAEDGSPTNLGTLTGQRWGQGGLELEVKFPMGTRWLPAQQVRVPHRKAPVGSLDPTKLPEIRASWQQHLESYPDNYPNLKPETWEAQSVATGVYNCVANSIHVERRPHWPGAYTFDFDNLYAEHGYVPLGKMDWSLQEGVEKIVLFAVGPDDRLGNAYERVLRMIGEDDGYDPKCVCTHAIVQEPDGAFSSKMGGLERIRVLDPQALAGGFAGHPIRVYARLIPSGSPSTR